MGGWWASLAVEWHAAKAREKSNVIGRGCAPAQALFVSPLVFRIVRAALGSRDSPLRTEHCSLPASRLASPCSARYLASFAAAMDTTKSDKPAKKSIVIKNEGARPHRQLDLTEQ